MLCSVKPRCKTSTYNKYYSQYTNHLLPAFEKLHIADISNLRDDGYKTFSIRVKDEIVDSLDKISSETNRNRNELINLLLEFGIENCEIVD